MNLWAISDLHLGQRVNRQALESITQRPRDWLILAGDVADTETQLAEAFAFLQSRFAQLIWVPGNHELWVSESSAGAKSPARGEARYWELIALARSFGVLTPEDAYPIWPGNERPIVIAPLFTLYDYSFRPEEIPRSEVVAWAAADGVASADETFLDSAPYSSRASWCAARVASTAARLSALPAKYATVLVNHYPLERDHALLPRIPRFAPWCGTTLTAGWYNRFRAVSVVYGHLHVRRSFEQDGVSFHEVSLGYPEQWDQRATLDAYLRIIL
jgi:hypothetical protein